MAIRRASPADVTDMVHMLEDRRRQYEAYQPVMWKRAAGSERLTTQFFGKQIADPAALALVSDNAGRIDGFLIAREMPTPPVYDPGGQTVLVDDFCVDDPALWLTVGRELLLALRAERRPGWRQMLVVCGDADKAKSALLADFGLTIASNWWTTPFID